MAAVITEEEFRILKSTVDKRLGRSPDKGDKTYKADPGSEHRLMARIMKYCKEQGFPCQCFRQSIKAKGFLVPGWMDCIILAPGGRVLLIELKGEKGVLRKEQQQLRLMAYRLGHTVYVIRSFKRFLEVIKEGERL